jgi:uncharacterized protein (DUF58 family)
LIYPSTRLFIGIAAGAALAMVVGVLAPALWLAPLVWTLLLLSAAAVDVMVALRRAVPAQLEAASAVIVGDSLPLRLVLPAGRPGRVTEAAFSADDLLRLQGAGRVRVAADGTAEIMATALRRGIARVTALDLRWQGPLGLAWLLRRTLLDRAITITPDLRPVHSDGVALLARDARVGMMVQLVTGPGGEFEALADYQPGMDRRRIDWKQSARHSALLAKEFHAERDNNIVLAFDCGRTMIEPLGGLARLDRAITAGLLTGYVALKMGDRVSLFGFDAKVRQLSAPRTGAGSFAALRREAAGLEYAAEESNFTLALSTLVQKLDRRSLIILFTDFVDATSAELMLRAVGRLLANHVLLCVVMRDDELETLVQAAPGDADDVSRAVIAADLLKERRLVLTRLRRMGAEVLEAPWQDVGPQLARRYLDTKRRQLL